MKLPYFFTAFSCAYNTQKALSLIISATHKKSIAIDIVKIYHNKTQKISLSTAPTEPLYRNSFMPVIIIDIQSNGPCSQIDMKFAFKKSVVFFIYIFFVFSLLLELIAVALLLCNSLTSAWLLLLPGAMLGFSMILAYLGLYLSSQGVFKLLLGSLNYDNIEAPKLNLTIHKKLQSVE